MKHPHLDAHRIDRKLWIGSQRALRDSTLRSYPFDVVVLCALEIQSIRLRGVHVVKAPLTDVVDPTEGEIKTAVSAARTVHHFRQRGKRVLVTCAQGVNRSSWVAAMALMLSGDSADVAIQKIRDNRKPPIDMIPLSNPGFIEILHRFRKPERRVAVHRPISAM